MTNFTSSLYKFWTRPLVAKVLHELDVSHICSSVFSISMVGGRKQTNSILEQLSNEKNPGCLGYIGDYTTQLYRDYNKLL